MTKLEDSKKDLRTKKDLSIHSDYKYFPIPASGFLPS
jgi:hypothetical protein